MEQALNKGCRFYKKRLPDEGDLVVVAIKDVGEHSITVELLEYNRIEGMITQAEYTRMRKSKYNQGILKAKKMRKQEVCYVIRVDKDKEFIDLSKKQIQTDQAKEVEDQFEKGKKVQNLMYPLCDALKMDIESLYELIVWPLTTKDTHAYDALQEAIFDFDKIIGPLNLPENIRERFREELKKKFTPQAVKIKATFEMSCYSKRAIEDIREALRKGEEDSTEDMEIKVNLIASPEYIIQTNTINKQKGIEAIKNSLKKIKEAIEIKEGKFEVTLAPGIVGDKEKALQQLIQDKKDENDNDEEDNDEGMGTIDLEEQ